MKVKKIISILLIVLILLNMFQTTVKAVNLDEAYIEDLGQCERHLQYWKESDNIWSYIITTMVGYRINGTLHYAYCMQRERPGVGSHENYSVKISEMLNNEVIWRAIINGFPYKSPAELGVENEEDAFVATKQAIYCVIYDWDASTRYRGVDERGWQITNAIINIVQEARTGTSKPNDSNVLKINKVGELSKVSNNFYSQEFSVNSTVEMSNCTIEKLENLPQGSFSADSNNNPKSTFSANEHFKILIPTQNILENFTGKIKINSTVKTYPVFYGSSYDSNLQDYALTYDSFNTIGEEISFDVNAHKSGIKLLKKDSETSLPISNVEFNFKYSDGTNIGNYKTDKNGIINISNLLPGKVIVTEIKTQSQYVLDSNKKELTLKYNENAELEITNEKIKGKIKIIKTSEDDNLITGDKSGTPLKNVEFKIYDSNGKLVDTISTDSKGIAITKALPKGSYSIKETKTQTSYVLNSSKFTAEISNNGQIVEVQIKNKSQTPPPPVEEPKVEKQKIEEPKIEEPPKLPVTGY